MSRHAPTNSEIHGGLMQTIATKNACRNSPTPAGLSMLHVGYSISSVIDHYEDILTMMAELKSEGDRKFSSQATSHTSNGIMILLYAL